MPRIDDKPPVALLSTCLQIHSETALLPYALNSLLFYWVDDLSVCASSLT
jgi:hypothetical protein